MEDPLESLLEGRPGLLRMLVFELTDACNLRCVYCHHNRPGFVATRTATRATVERVMEGFRTEKPRIIELTGGGELTMAPGWMESCAHMQAYGIPLWTTLNLARPLTPEAASVLARFAVISVSVDSVDPANLRRYRRGAEIETIAANIARVRAEAATAGAAGPEWRISAVFYGEIVSQLSDLTAWAAAVGASEFGIQDLLQYDDIAANVTAVWALTGERATRAVEQTRLALAAAERAGLAVRVPGGFTERLDDLERRHAGGAATGGLDAKRPVERSSAGGDGPGRPQTTFTAMVATGETRLCLDPWIYSQVLGDGTLRPCCFSGRVLGRVEAGSSFRDHFDGATAHALRRELLTGALDEYCRICNLKGIVRTEDLVRRVAALYAQTTPHSVRIS